jgi:CobQ-like glutamine amidotransferase family enzyme
MEINITHLYPHLLNLYGDRGNIAALSKRLNWRGLKANVTEITDEFSLCNTDILLLGGGSESQQDTAKKLLSQNRDELKNYIENGGVMLGVCGGFEMLAQLGFIPASVKEGERISDNKIISCDIDGKSFLVSGFENHSCTVITNGLQPLGKVVYGRGESEGIIYKNVFATFMYGPLLPKNPELADIILARALKGKYPDFEELSTLDDEFENLAHKNIVERCSLNAQY